MSGLGFMQPGYLWGLLFLAVPVIIHLLNRRRTVTLPFSTTRFFEETAVRAQKTRTLRRLLQLLARLLLTAALVLAFAGPVDKRDPFNVLQGPQTAVYCWVDPTVSMSYRDRGRSCHDWAEALLDSIDAMLPAGGQRYRFSDQRREFVALGGRGTAREEVRHGPVALERFSAALRDSLRGRRRPAVLVVISDFQEGTSAAVERLLLADTAQAPVALVSVAPGRPVNAGVRSPRVSEVNSALLTATVYAVGRDLGSGVLQATVRGMRVGHGAVALKAGDSLVCTVPVSLGARMEQGALTLEPGDGFSADNAAYFVRRRSASRTALLIGDARKSYPLKAALQAGGAGFWDSVVVRDNIDVTSEDFESAALVVLNELDMASVPVQAFLESRSLGRKAVVFSPGLRVGATGFNNRVLAALGLKGAVAVDSAASGQRVSLPDTVSALWRGFPRLVDRDAVVRRYLRALPGQPLAGLGNAATLVSSTVDAYGSLWILAATPLGISEDNNLCETGFFVPFMDRIVRYALAGVAGSDEEWSAGVPRRNPYFESGSSAQVYDESNALVASWGQQPSVALPRPGLYRVQPFGEAAYWIAVNTAPSETTLDYRQPEAPPALRPRVRHFTADSFLGFLAHRRISWLSASLWTAVLLLLMAETLLWQRPHRGLR